MRPAFVLLLPVLTLPLAFVAFIASCAVVTTWDGLTGDAAAPSDARATENDADAGASSPRCVAGELTCAGPLLAGDPKVVYRCLADGGGAVEERCTNACQPLEGRDDRCQCVPNSTYCGGDRIDGDPRALYRCLADGGVLLLEACDGGCVIHVGDDDACK